MQGFVMSQEASPIQTVANVQVAASQIISQSGTRTPTTRMDASATISSLEDLKKLNPEVYHGFMKLLAQNMLTFIKRNHDHAVKRMKEERKKDGG